MDHNKIIEGLARNGPAFETLLAGSSSEEYLWRPQAGKWCLLEIVCHLYDEEREDFRARTKHVLETPSEPLPPIDPPGWVLERKYIAQDYDTTLKKFLEERERSVQWLRALISPRWDNAYHHPKFGEMTAKMFLANWAAHDYLHIRQIIRLKFEYLKHISGEQLTYAGEW